MNRGGCLTLSQFLSSGLPISPSWSTESMGSCWSSCFFCEWLKFLPICIPHLVEHTGPCSFSVSRSNFILSYYSRTLSSLDHPFLLLVLAGSSCSVSCAVQSLKMPGIHDSTLPYLSVPMQTIPSWEGGPENLSWSVATGLLCRSAG